MGVGIAVHVIARGVQGVIVTAPAAAGWLSGTLGDTDWFRS